MRLAHYASAVLVLLATVPSGFARCHPAADPDRTDVANARAAVATRCDCAAAADHRAYVSCAVQQAKAVLANKRCVGAVKRCAAKSTCGKSGAVACCRTSAGGATKCSTAKDAARCRPPRGGTACASNFASCCDACSATGCAPGPHAVTVTLGTGATDCGSAGLLTGPTPPFSHELLDGAGAKVADLGANCVYQGGGNNTFAPPATDVNGSASVYDVALIDGPTLTLKASAGNGERDCTQAAGPGRHCANGNPGTGAGACTTDADCGGVAASCNLDPHCYIGPPGGVPNGPFSACFVNVVQSGLVGTADTAAGSLVVTLPAQAWFYFTGMAYDDPLTPAVEPCPRCLGGTCNAGKRAGLSCTPASAQQTTLDCLPLDSQFFFALDLQGALATVTTATASITDAGGNFCPGQMHPGAFGRSAVRTITERGSPVAGGLSSTPGAATLVTTGCLATTGNAGIDALIDLPGPLATSFPGTVSTQ